MNSFHVLFSFYNKLIVVRIILKNIRKNVLIKKFDLEYSGNDITVEYFKKERLHSFFK